MPCTFVTLAHEATLPVAADLHGQSRHGTTYRRGGVVAVSFRQIEEPEPPSVEPPVETTRQWLNFKIGKVLERYAAGTLTEIELRTIRALWLQGATLRSVAAHDGVTPEAVRARIEGNRHGQGGVRRKAPEFYRWWAFKQRHRRTKGIR